MYQIGNQVLSSVSTWLVCGFPDQSLFRALIGRDTMQTISRYPIFPSTTELFMLPVGGQLLEVSLSSNSYYLHVLHNPGAALNERRIIALQDDATYKDLRLGAYIGSAAQAGDARRWHFFEQGKPGDAL